MMILNNSVKIIRTFRHQHRFCLLKNGNVNKRLLSTTVVVRLDISDSLIQDPSLASLGLAGKTPPGLFQAILEQVHLGFDVPWWGAIVATTFTLRVFLVPLFIRARRNAVVTHNVSPNLFELQSKIDTAKTKQEIFKYRKEYFDFMSKHGISPISTLVPVLGNASIFTTMFFALRGMTEMPVESLKTGGAFWFNDLTSSDPYFLLPVLTTSSLLLHLWIGGEGQSLDSLPPFMRKLIFALPIISFPVMCSFPSALNLYWLSSNIFTITQARLLSIPKIRESVGIPALKPHNNSNSKEDSMDFLKRIKEIEKRVAEEMKKK